MLLLTSCLLLQTVFVLVVVDGLSLTPELFIAHVSCIYLCIDTNTYLHINVYEIQIYIFFCLLLQSTRNPINIHKSQNKASLACNHHLTPPPATTNHITVLFSLFDFIWLKAAKCSTKKK